jgi:hypothetical protein
MSTIQLLIVWCTLLRGGTVADAAHAANMNNANAPAQIVITIGRLSPQAKSFLSNKCKGVY